MKHIKFKTSKSTTAAWTKQSRKRQDFKKGFLWDGSDGVDHVARDVLQHGVANRGSRREAVQEESSFFRMFLSQSQHDQ